MACRVITPVQQKHRGIGIENHYRLELSKLRGSPWIWILDGAGFDMRHALELRIAIAIAKILYEYGVDRIYVSKCIC